MTDVRTLEAGLVGPMVSVLGRAVRAVGEAGVPYVVFGSIASVLHGRPGETEDIDLLLLPIVRAGGGDLAWDRILDRATVAPKRVLAAVADADSCGLAVPAEAVRRLVDLASPA